MDSLRDPLHYMPDDASLARIREQIGEYNIERPTIRRQAYFQVALYMGGYVAVLLFLLYLMFRAGHVKNNPIGYVFGGVAICGWWIWDFAWRPVKDHQLALQYRLFPVIFGFIENFRYSHGEAPGFLDQIRVMKLIQFLRSDNDDVISGRHDGLRFEMVESKLRAGTGNDDAVLFQGLILRFPLKEPFAGLLVAARRGNRFEGWLHGLFGRHADLIPSGDPEVDATHEIHTDNYRAARPVAEGPLVSAIRYLRRSWWDDEARIALRDRDCFLLLPSNRNYFALPPIDQDVDYDRDVLPMIRDMVVLLAIAHLMSKIGLQQEDAPAGAEVPAGPASGSD